MVNQGPSTGLGELPGASPAVPKIIEATGDSVVAPLLGVDRPSVSETAEVSGVNAKVPVDATLAPSIDASLDDLDIPLSALLNAPGQSLDDTSHGGENACPPQEKEKGVTAEGTPGDGVASTSSPASPDSCRISRRLSVSWGPPAQQLLVSVCDYILWFCFPG